MAHAGRPIGMVANTHADKIGRAGAAARPEDRRNGGRAIDPILALTVVAVLVNLGIMGVLVLPGAMGRRSAIGVAPLIGEPERSPVRMAATGAAMDDALEDVPPEAYDRVVRVVSWTFVLAVATIVAVTGLWQATQPAIFVLLALTALFILVVHELLPPETLGTAKFVVEGSAAITVVTLLILLTGQASSPFFFAYPLIVAGAALVVTPPITIALAGIASMGYLLAVLLPVGQHSLGLPAAALVGINLTSLLLLAYVAMVIAREQRGARDAAIRLSTVDSLTGLFNRAFFFAALEREIARSSRSGRGFCLLMMDLDELKLVNDRFGHFHGDRLLRGVGAVIRAGVRRIDTPARYGGDEFVVLCPETDPTGAFVLAEKIREEVADLELQDADSVIKASLSIGVVAFPDDGRTADELMITADQAMYSSKRFGKNRVTGAPSGPMTTAGTTQG
jgi:diguanylate cyclase (GGDEF)-like protein